MKKFQVDVDGHVFALVTKDAAMCIFRKDRQQEVYLIDGNGDSRRAESRREIRGHSGIFGIHVGLIGEFLFERRQLFPDLDTVCTYYKASGKFPWGFKSIMASRGWYNREVRGYKYVIRDEAGNREMRLRKDGGIEIDFITPVF